MNINQLISYSNILFLQTTFIVTYVTCQVSRIKPGVHQPIYQASSYEQQTINIPL